KAASLIRGTAARFLQKGYKLGGFDAYTTSDVLRGSGLSSSAAFEVLVGTMLNHSYNDGKISAVEIAQIGQYAENFYFGKPSGLMDQTASSVGGFVAIDFKDPENPIVEKVDYDFAKSGYTLCIVDTGGNHADLTCEYAAIPEEMKNVAAFFGKSVLRDVDTQAFYDKLPELRHETGDRAVLRAIHFFAENEKAKKEADALKAGDFNKFKKIVIASGESSFNCLQNVFTTQNVDEQGLSLALALTKKMLSARGAWRVHGGGFAGTIQAFVPNDMLADYKYYIEKVFGYGNCHVLSIRPVGGIKVEL
ncbi:MAG: galactokinase, partial [Hydrogenoanaerobacterium sp.]